MKRLFLLSAFVLLGLMLPAQTQHGYVKTKGRMIDGKLVPGQGLKNTIVSIHGHTAILVDKDDGAFSFPILEPQFHIDSVRKKGYQLVDLDVLTRTYKHSSNPIYLVMETPEQQLQDQLSAERLIRRTITAQLDQRENEIAVLRRQLKITEKEYHQAIQKLYKETNQNEQLISALAKEYSLMDYDQMDESKRRIRNAILNGNLTEADSLLHSKGSINERIAEIRKEQLYEAQREAELEQALKDLADAKLNTLKKLEDVANDCYMYYYRFQLEYQCDSAAYYIEEAVKHYSYIYETNQFIPKEFLSAIVSLLSLSSPDENSSYSELNKKWLPRVIEMFKKEPTVYARLSYRCIYAKNFALAELFAYKAIIHIKDIYCNLEVYSYYAAACLFQGKYNGLEYPDPDYLGFIQNYFLKDLNDFEAAGVIPEERKADVERIKKLLLEE